MAFRPESTALGATWGLGRTLALQGPCCTGGGGGDVDVGPGNIEAEASALESSVRVWLRPAWLCLGSFTLTHRAEDRTCG